jgi:hypothetical protein
MARGKWTTSYRDKGKAQYEADQTAAAIVAAQQAQQAPAGQQQLQEAWQAGYRAGWEAHQAAMQQPPQAQHQFGQGYPPR